jgi:hypothetical protein
MRRHSMVTRLDELELSVDVGLYEQVDRAAIDTIVLERAILKMWRPYSTPCLINRCRLTAVARFKRVARGLLRRRWEPRGHRRPWSSRA